eukprot:4731203-Pyramimonas_sp.AAC.1
MKHRGLIFNSRSQSPDLLNPHLGSSRVWSEEQCIMSGAYLHSGMHGADNPAGTPKAGRRLQGH